MDLKLKKIIKHLSVELEDIGNRLFNNVNCATILQYDLLNFMIFLSAADGVISSTECKVMEEYVDLEINPSDVVNIINEYNIRSREFLHEVPTCIRLSVAGDNFAYKNGVGNEKVSDAIYGVYLLLLKELARADGEITRDEAHDGLMYVDNIKKYMENNLLERRQEDKEIEVTLNNDVVIAPRKG